MEGARQHFPDHYVARMAVLVSCCSHVSEDHDSTKKSLLTKRRYLQWHKSPNVGQDPVGLTGSGVLLLISIGVAAVQLCRNSYSEIIWEKTPKSPSLNPCTSVLGISRSGVTWETRTDVNTEGSCCNRAIDLFYSLLLISK